MLFLLVFTSPAAAQVRPLATDDGTLLADGQVRLSVGGTWQRRDEEPAYGLEGDLLHLPAIDAAYGLGGVAELNVSTGMRTLWISRRAGAPLASILDIPGTRSSAPQDIVIATKVRLFEARARRPALAVRVATKLPNAGNESGLGSDTTDVSLTVLATWTRARSVVSANLGTAIVGDPSQLGVQHDPTLFGMSLSRRVSERSEIVAEVAGRWLPGHPRRPGSENRTQVRAGLRHAVGTGGLRVDAALVGGLGGVEAPLGVTAGVTWTSGSSHTP